MPLSKEQARALLKEDAERPKRGNTNLVGSSKWFDGDKWHRGKPSSSDNAIAYIQRSA